MQTTANEILTWARESIKSLSHHPAYRTLTAVYAELSATSGVSVSTIMKVYDGQNANPTIETIDKIVAAIKLVTRKAAA